MATYYQTEPSEDLQINQFAHLVEAECRVSLGKFKSALSSYALFHLSFTALSAVQLTITLLLLFTNPSSPIFAIAFASLLLTICSHVLINYYFQGKKPIQFKEIESNFYNECVKILPIDAEDDDYHLSLAHSMFQLATYINQRQVYSLSFKPFSLLEDLFLVIGYHLHFKDVLMMQELLLHRSIEEHIKLIMNKPTDLAVHTSLANAYTALAKIYQKPTDLPFEDSRYVDARFAKDSIKGHFTAATNKAIEELKILDDLAPNDPWVHAQLANCYHHLSMFEEEIREYEILLNIRPNDKEILYRVGLLYFRLGKNAKGLTIYGHLKEIDAKDALHLISHYSSLTLHY